MPTLWLPSLSPLSPHLSLGPSSGILRSVTETSRPRRGRISPRTFYFPIQKDSEIELQLRKTKLTPRVANHSCIVIIRQALPDSSNTKSSFTRDSNEEANPSLLRLAPFPWGPLLMTLIWTIWLDAFVIQFRCALLSPATGAGCLPEPARTVVGTEGGLPGKWLPLTRSA